MIDTPSQDLSAVESELLAQTQGAHVLWCGRAATALIWAYQLAHARRPEVAQPEIIMPSMMCTTAAFAAEWAGMIPRFADVDPHTGLITLENIQERVTARTIAVVVVHLYGSTADVVPIHQWCAQRGIAVIEDVAQAQGARLPDGAPVGSAGDMAVYSFNSTKILESGGGALVVRAPVAEAMREWRAAPQQEVPAPIRAQLGQSYRNLHHSLAAALRLEALTPSVVTESFARLKHAYYPLYWRPAPPDPVPLLRDWPSLGERLAARYEKAKLYARSLAGGPWRLLDGWQASGVCWRFSLLLDNPQHTVALSEALRKDGFYVSNLYWPPAHFFRPSDATPHADRIARCVINLWVNEQVDRAGVLATCERLWRYAEQLRKEV